MPIVPSKHKAPFYLFNGHLQTIIPSLFRQVDGVLYLRERLVTPDDDFIDIDWSKVGSNELVILSHGLEGDSGRPYIQGMVKAFNKHGVDALAWNYRSCSGEPNKLLRSYHLGASDDLDFVVRHALDAGSYDKVYLVGFSAGGNISLKYLGEAPEKVPAEIKRAAVFSVPVDLKSSAKQISRIYTQRFLKSLGAKLEQKRQMYPDDVDLSDYSILWSFPEFDDRYTAPLHGFKNAEDYYKRVSSKQFIPKIKVPTLLVNAKNDPFLGKPCYPIHEAEQNPLFFLEIPEEGGHVGFTEDFRKDDYYSEARAIRFILEEQDRERVE
ncbi:YheT family hydrolase [Pontibacter cellulosilyticus]|uniref:Alpha/beta fold hydrolase n=1 Tax=Pontibacter cellulosilyticus TaxID=1720253 RepID=A0A923N7N5_9BACT|nr:alpha/beta fold hydrolase [Pontibacter cellulosilyticus]MBC5993282.1 alpha/beta fold hydrolase [Pontibacter cellulosilyticus]